MKKKPKKERTLAQLIADLRKTKPKHPLEVLEKKAFFAPSIYGFRRPFGWW